MPDNKTRKPGSRRHLLKSVTVGGGLAAIKGVPGTWSRPVIDSVVLPAHAQTSPQFTCSIPFSFEFSAVKSSPGIAGTYTGTQEAAGPFTGDCQEAGIQFAESPLEIEITPSNSFNVTYIVGGETIWTRILVIQLGILVQLTVLRPFLLFGQFPARERTDYALTVTENAVTTISGQANGVVQVDETAGP